MYGAFNDIAVFLILGPAWDHFLTYLELENKFCQYIYSVTTFIFSLKYKLYQRVAVTDSIRNDGELPAAESCMADDDEDFGEVWWFCTILWGQLAPHPPAKCLFIRVFVHRKWNSKRGEILAENWSKNWRTCAPIRFENFPMAMTRIANFHEIELNSIYFTNLGGWYDEIDRLVWRRFELNWIEMKYGKFLPILSNFDLNKI